MLLAITKLEFEIISKNKPFNSKLKLLNKLLDRDNEIETITHVGEEGAIECYEVFFLFLFNMFEPKKSLFYIKYFIRKYCLNFFMFFSHQYYIKKFINVKYFMINL